MSGVLAQSIGGHEQSSKLILGVVPFRDGYLSVRYPVHNCIIHHASKQKVRHVCNK